MAMRSVLSRVSVSVAGRMEWTPGASRFSKVSNRPVSHEDTPAEHDNILIRVKDCLEEVKKEIEKKKAEKEKEDAANKKSWGTHLR